MNFHIHRIEFEIKMNNADIIDIFLRSFEKINHVENLVELFKKKSNIDFKRKYHKEIIKIIYKLSIMKYFEYSMNNFREKIEYSREYI